MLAAFMALVAFQANAQYDGKTQYFLNVWSANQTSAKPGHFWDNFGVTGVLEYAKDYPLSADKVANPLHNESMKYVVDRPSDTWELTNAGHSGKVGETQAYFSITANIGALTGTYKIRSKSTEAVDDVIYFNKDGVPGARGANSIEDFQFVRFLTEDYVTEYDGTHSSGTRASGGVIDSVGMVPWAVKTVAPQEGGYLIGYTSVIGGRSTANANDRGIWVVAYDTSKNNNGAPHNRYAIYSMDQVRKNWAAYYAGTTSVRIVPVWVKADPIGGRWATKADFPNEFINFINQNTKSALVVDGVSVFNVIGTEALNFQSGSDITKSYSTSGTAHNSALTPTSMGDNPMSTGGDHSRLFQDTDENWKLQTFVIMDPCTQNLLSVKKEQVPGTPLINGVAAFGNKLEMRAAYTAATSKESLEDLIRIQKFAIWINVNGDMELYPLNSWNYDTSNSSYNTNPTTPHYNFAVWNDRPYANVTDSEVDGFNRSFKIGQMNGTPCTGPVSGTYTGYNNLPLRPLKAELINKIGERRFYFIEVKQQNILKAYTTSTGAHTVLADSFYVLDVVPTDVINSITGKPYKRVVVTAKEKNRYNYAATGKDRYFDTPYDSVNMSAHWQFVWAPSGGGYNIVNELGDTLEYSYAGLTTQTAADRAYLVDKLPTLTAGTYTSDVWQSVHLDCFNGMFKLRNMAETPIGNERTSLQYAYLDTMKNIGSGDGASNPWWYAGQRGRQANTETGYNYTNHLQKDVCLGNIGMLLKLTPIAYEYPTGGASDSKTNHSDDLYSPADDSLCTYLFKEGFYDIREALSNTLRVEGGYTGPDPKYGENLAYFTKDNTRDPWLWVEPVVSTSNPDLEQYKYVTPMVYNDAVSGLFPNVDYMLTKAQMNALKKYPSKKVAEFLKQDTLTLDVYKWHYVKNNKGEYLVYDTINTTTSTKTQQLGFKFMKVDRTNATAFRFYQPLVGDKHMEYFLMEFRVAKHDYNVDRTAVGGPVVSYRPWNNSYSNDNYGINPLIVPAGSLPASTETAWKSSTASLSNSDLNTLAGKLNSDPTFTNMTIWTEEYVMKYLEHMQAEHVARTKYALITTGSDLLLSTWNAGRFDTDVQAATRFKFTGPDMTQCPRDYVDSKYLIDNQMYSIPLTVQEWDVWNEVLMNNYMQMNTTTKYAVNAANPLNLIFTLADTLKVGATAGHGYIKTFGATGTANNDRYRSYENTREVELYYIQNPLNPELFLTVDTTSVFGQTIMSAQPGVSGVKLRWEKLYTATSNAYSSVGEKADYRPLQMFAIYGCKSTQAPTYGSFIFIPAASWVVNYNAPFKQTSIRQNAKIGNGPVFDEFRVGEWGKDGQLIVMPSSDEVSFEGISATEYMFNRSEYYSGDFCEHNFIQDKDSKYYASWKSGIAKKSYYDATMHWNVKKVNGTTNLYEFYPEGSEFDENGEKVPTRNQLLGQFFLYETAKSKTADGGNIQTFLAIPKYYDIQHLQLKKITITCITDHNPGQPGDNCMIKYKKFTNDDLAYDWAILETVYADRYIYSKGKVDGTGYVGGIAAAYEESVNTTGGKVNYLRIRESNFVVDPGHENDPHFHHGVPYYNIIHVTTDANNNEVEHYLEMKLDGTVQFRTLNPRESEVMVNYDKYAADTLQAFKFCFPFKEVGDSTTTLDGKYKDANVAIRTMPYHNQIMWLAINRNATSQVYADPESGGTFFFGPKAETGEEWVGQTDKSGWLKDFSRPDVYIVDPSDLSPVNYGLLSYVETINPIDHAKLTFKLVYDTIVNKYTKDRIWYYNILDSKGNYLTMVNTKADSASTNYNYGDYTYAYFTSKKIDSNGAHGADKGYYQTFGLQRNLKAAADTVNHSYPFWIVAQVPSGEYKYLAQWNNRLVFMNSKTSSKAAAQKGAMTFEIGKVAGKTFTDVPAINGNGVAVYGLDGAVKVVNAKGAIELYTIDGRMVKSVAATGTEQTIAAPRGVVIVKNGTNVAKVVVK